MTPLIASEELVGLLGNSNTRVLDCRWALDDPEYGPVRYLESHIQGALYAHLDHDLSGEKLDPSKGRRPGPRKEDWARKLSSWGINAGTHVVVYDDRTGDMAAARAWVLLRWAGIRHVQVLNGGWSHWHGPRQCGPSPEPQPVTATEVSWQDSWLASLDEVRQALTEHHSTLVDARPSDQFNGLARGLDPVAGHIPGSRNVPYDDLMTSDGFLREPEALEYVLRRHGADAHNVIASCGSGVWASLVPLAREVAGLPPGRLFVGSWSCWIAHPELPIMTS